MPRSLALLIAAWSCLAAAPATARDVYVNNLAGSDTFNGVAADSRDRSGPVQTISRALLMARKGDRVVIANTGRPYRECLSVQGGRNSGLFGSPFTILGNGAVIDGSLPVPREAWEHFERGIYRFRPRKLSHQQLFIDAKPVERVPLAASLLAPFPKLQPMQWCLYQGHVYFRPAPQTSPEAYNLSNSALLTGITLYEVRGVQIRDLVVQGFVYDGVNAHDGAVDVELSHLTCRGNGRCGISIGGASKVRIDGCLLGSNAEAQVRILDYTQVQLSNSKMFDTPTAPAIDRRGGKLDYQPLAEGPAAAASRDTIYTRR